VSRTNGSSSRDFIALTPRHNIRCILTIKRKERKTVIHDLYVFMLAFLIPLEITVCKLGECGMREGKPLIECIQATGSKKDKGSGD
jgi:hypothetical protein